jgi:hypothetical protein
VTPALLLQRIEAIGRSLAASGHALALIALGSIGQETDRLDAWSDLDFFVVVEPGRKARYLDRLDWLAAVHPLAWHFRNTPDGHKVLMDDGVFCEFAVFEPAELGAIPFAPGRIVWKRDDADAGLAQPRRPLPPAALPDETWIVGEALGCLIVGLQRWRRGEQLSAARLVQCHAVDRLIELDALRQQQRSEEPAGADPFNRERRVEQRQPTLTAELPRVMPGYEHTPAAALALLAALQRRGAQLNPAATSRIRMLAAGATAG